MEYNVRDDALRLVIRYLNYDEMKNVSLTCRTWEAILAEETNVKGPLLLIQEIKINRYNRAVANNETIFLSTDMNPFLLLCFTNKNCNSDIAKRHMSKANPDDCILVELKRDIFEDVNTVWTILFQFSISFNVKTLYFVTKCRVPAPTLRWLDLPSTVGRLRVVPTYFRQLHELSDWYNTMNNDPDVIDFFLILFCTYSDIPELIEIIAQLSTWYPLKGPIWGCTINSAQVFRNTLYKGPESYEANCIQIYITGEELVKRVLILNEHCNTREKIQMKFEDLKSAACYEDYTIAFMCTSVARYTEFFEIESSAFKEVFPDVPLTHIFSRRPFLAENLEEFYTYLRNIQPLETINVTTVLLFAYFY